jgi:glycosyltransferase involved in cell wall biosynthesis
VEKLYITYYAGLGQKKGISGGDNILIELARRWTEKFDITILTGVEGQGVCFRQGLQVKFQICPSKYKWMKYIERMYWSILSAINFQESGTTVYTSSDFWHDLFFGVIVKKNIPSTKWIAGFYLVCPPPFSKRSPYKGLARIRGIGYWLTQRLSLWVTNKYADIIFVTSEPDRKFFPNKKVVVIRGGVNIPPKPNLCPYEWKWFDAMFMGRFHYQKGVLELIDIWRDVVSVRPDAKLLMVGDGPLKKKCLEKFHKLKLENNITFKDFADNNEKILYFYESRLILHPATFESGGMSAAEGMAYRIPAIGFDLPVYDTYYPKGMMKVGNKKAFSSMIIEMLSNRHLWNKISNDAFELVINDWDWNKRAEDIYKEIL